MLSWEIAVGLLVAVIGLAYYYFTSTFSYWKNKGVKFVKPYPVVGSMLRVMTLREHVVQFFLRTYQDHQNEPFVGYFQGRSPALLVIDPDLIKNIIIKDFSHFVDHGFKICEESDPLQARNLFNMEGQRWKEMRAKLSPTFTSGRMKSMFPLVEECALEFENYLGGLADKGEYVDIKDLLARYTTDVISSCAFGIKSNSIADPNCHFRVMGRKLMETTFLQAIKNAMITFAPEIAMRLKFSFTSPELTEFFRNMVREVTGMRAKTGTTRKDFMQLLIELKEKGRLTSAEDDENEVKELSNGHASNGQVPSNTNKLSDDDVTAQALVFFFAGFETSSTALSFALFELARLPELQLTARNQIEEVLKRHDGKMSYQALQEMTYLDWILNESLRKYPPVTALMRECTKNYTIPGTKVTIDKGTQVQIPIHALQNNCKYHKNAEKFIPERFGDEKEVQKNQYIYMPFGEGPRQCIGLRFARMQSKLGLVSVLRKYDVQPSPRTKYPLSWNPQQFLLVSKEDIYLKLHRAQADD